MSGAPILITAAMREAERASGVPLAELMERAGRAVAEEVRRFAGPRPVLVLCGPGNNGGDGWVAAVWLAEWGHDVAVAQIADPATELARAPRARWSGPVSALEDAAARPVLVDALFGLGLTRALTPDVAAPLQRLAAAAEFVLAVDLPSGLSADDGRDLGAVNADVTVALGALKPAHRLMPGLARCGRVLVHSLGLQADSAVRDLGRPTLHAPAQDAQKFSRGLVAVVAGSMPGAGRLAAGAALSAGAGYVRLLSLSSADTPLDAITVEVGVDIAAALADGRIGAALIGSGLGRDATARTRLDEALASAAPLVIDGDALTLFGRDAAARLRGRASPSILTPHGGEFERLAGPVETDKLTATRALAATTGAVVLHKGPDTVIACPEGRVRVSVAGPSWLSTAGSGDVLAGAVAARLSVGGDPFRAACEAVWLHGRAAQRAGPALRGDDLLAQLPRAVAECL